MAEELADDLKNFKLTEDEEVIVGKDLQKSDDNSHNKKVALMMIGKLLTDRPFNYEVMKRTLKSVWRLKDEMTVRMVNSILFTFQFSSMVDKKKVINGAPWFFDNQLLLLKEVSGKEQIIEIRVYNVPLAQRRYEIAKEIEHFMRMKMKMDITKPLRRGLKIATG
ncbi:ATP-dependent zinc metalloprotease FtsH [Bienertia sinuspersici]